MQRRSRAARLSPRMLRHVMNLWPAIRGTGVRVTYIADDWSELTVRLPLNLRTRNYVGTIFGGSMYGAIDPYYMLLFMHRLGPDYVVWDKGATIRFRRPGTGVLTGRFSVTDDEVADIRRDLDEQGSFDRSYHVELVNERGEVVFEADKLLYFATREVYAARQARSTAG